MSNMNSKIFWSTTLLLFGSVNAQLVGGRWSLGNLKKRERLPANPPIYIYMNKINKRLVFKIKDGFKLELGTPEIMKVFSSTKKLIDKTKNGEHVPILEVVEVGIV